MESCFLHSLRATVLDENATWSAATASSQVLHYKAVCSTSSILCVLTLTSACLYACTLYCYACILYRKLTVPTGLDSMTKLELVAQVRGLGLKISGVKADLIARIRAHRQA
jgi:SAP domain